MAERLHRRREVRNRMCQFCHQHGEGRTWYLEAANYSTDRIRDPRRFRDLVTWLLHEAEPGHTGVDRLRRYLRLPLVGRAVRACVTRRLQRDHFGQVLPLEDVQAVFRLVDAISAFPCVCRRALGRPQEERYCFGLGTFFRELTNDFPLLRGGEELTVEEACRRVEAFESRGLIHTVWTLDTPFIIGICSCRPGDCLGLEMTLGLQTPTMFRGEAAFAIDGTRCTGCRKCLQTCYFNAIEHDPVRRRCRVRTEHCYGCGLCRRACPAGAVRRLATVVDGRVVVSA